jgi:site-specific DNA-methyltransferase (adenine-specific)
MKASEIRFIKGRLRFGDSKNSAPFPSALIIFRPDTDFWKPKGLKTSSYII